MTFMPYEEFSGTMNKIFEDGYSTLIVSISNNIDRFVGIFRATKPKLKLIQNITQSHEIKFGSALEILFENYFKIMGFEILDNVLSSDDTTDGDEYDIDQLLKDRLSNKIYLIEQKVRDDHDSTKKKGQFDNYEDKYSQVCVNYPDSLVIPIMWFIDPGPKKNKNYYLKRNDKMNEKWGCNSVVCYGGELFGIADKFNIEVWDEIVAYLKKWRKDLSEQIDINFDNHYSEAFEQIKNVELKYIERLLKDSDIKEQIFPEIFPEGKVLEKLKDYYILKSKDEDLNKKWKNRYAKAAEDIAEYLENNHLLPTI